METRGDDVSSSVQSSRVDLETVNYGMTTDLPIISYRIQIQMGKCEENILCIVWMHHKTVKKPTAYRKGRLEGGTSSG